MNITIALVKERAEFLSEYMGDRVRIHDDYREEGMSDDLVLLSVRVENGTDVVQLIHAGIEIGFNIASKYV